MNRRQFTQRLAAILSAPAMPMAGLAKAAPVAGTAAAAGTMYMWSAFISRAHNKCTPGMLMRLLKLEQAEADEIYSQLIADEIITPADAFGLSQAVKPLYPELTPGIGTMTRATSPNSDSVKRVARKLMREDADDPVEDSPTVNQDKAELGDEPHDELSDHSDPENRQQPDQLA
jgi:hypothetical protein